MLEMPMPLSPAQSARQKTSEETPDAQSKSAKADSAGFEDEYKDAVPEQEDGDDTVASAKASTDGEDAKSAKASPGTDVVETTDLNPEPPEENLTTDTPPRDLGLSFDAPNAPAPTGSDAKDSDASASLRADAIQPSSFTKSVRPNSLKPAGDAAPSAMGLPKTTAATGPIDAGAKENKPAQKLSTAETVVRTKALENTAARTAGLQNSPQTGVEKDLLSRGKDVQVAKLDPQSGATSSVSVAMTAASGVAIQTPQTVIADAKNKAEQRTQRSEPTAPPDIAAPRARTTNAAAHIFSPALPVAQQVSLGSQDKPSILTIPAVEDMEAALPFDARGPQHSGQNVTLNILQRAETPVLIARQMAEALQRQPDRPVEISLNPKELGRVRMSISAAEAGITVSVIVERPETLDLMRRNIDQLARDFELIGYSDINFAFSQGETQHNFSDETEQAQPTATLTIEQDEADASTALVPPVAVSTGIDIRL